MKEKIIDLIFESIEEISIILSSDQKLEKNMSTTLFGPDGKLDSLGLVNLLIVIEQNIEDEFDQSITIADERAMSQKYSPFRTIGSLAEYIEMLLKEMLNDW